MSFIAHFILILNEILHIRITHTHTHNFQKFITFKWNSLNNKLICLLYPVIYDVHQQAISRYYAMLRMHRTAHFTVILLIYFYSFILQHSVQNVFSSCFHKTTLLSSFSFIFCVYVPPFLPPLPDGSAEYAISNAYQAFLWM